jgi:DNA-binding NarL/FixJ family response regulator
MCACRSLHNRLDEDFVMAAIRILLADDHTLVRAGFRALISRMSEVEIVAEASDGEQALRLIEEHRPDIVLLDIAMPKLNGLEVAARVTTAFPALRVIILSMHANEEYVLQALRAGSSGYLIKDANTVELELAIRAVARGETYLSPAVSKRVIEDYVRLTQGGSDSPGRLTPRQRQVLQMIAAGNSTKEIAQSLRISIKTVETHRAQLMDELGIHDVAGLVRYAIRMGLVSPGE